MRHRFRALTVAVACGLALTACGGDDTTDDGTDEPTTQPTAATTTAGGTTADDCPFEPAGADNPALDVEASDAFTFVPETLEVAAGDVHITFDNPGVTAHSFVIEGTDFGMLAEAGDNCAGTVSLEPGTYTVFCDVVGHREAGMETTLTVS